MALELDTFNNLRGGNTLFKALGHPQSARLIAEQLGRLRGADSIAIFDPLGLLPSLHVLYPLDDLRIANIYVRDVAQTGKELLGCKTRPVTDLPDCNDAVLWSTSFDSGRALSQVRHMLPASIDVVELDEARLPEDWLSHPRQYLHPLNFATNFAFFRDAAGQHTRLVTANYWNGYGASNTRIWCALIDAAGEQLAEWIEPLPDSAASVEIDSREVRERFSLPEFTGSLFLHVLGVAGHDVVKYALDTYGDDADVLSCTHDANAWPADYYAGLPAPGDGERVILWVQNSHPRSIPAGAIQFNRMGEADSFSYEQAIPPFATRAIDVGDILAGVRYPQQIEVQAGKHFVRPRYEIIAKNTRRSRIAHVNVERTDIETDPGIAHLPAAFGKGFLLPAPVLPVAEYDSEVLPTPMARRQEYLPLALAVYGADGGEVLIHKFGRMARADSVVIGVRELLRAADAELNGGYGHMELRYDFCAGQEADGWLHALFRYRNPTTGHTAETSFGSHIFNIPVVYKDEPQSYAGSPPGLSTRLFLRLGDALDADTLCHLIYPASASWHPWSSSRLELHDAAGRMVASREIAIPCGGSMLWRYHETFDRLEREEAQGGYVLVRDTTCRLFGYHGLERGGHAFSLDHMFGF